MFGKKKTKNGGDDETRKKLATSAVTGSVLTKLNYAPAVWDGKSNKLSVNTTPLQN